jgi:hypothetical protein
MVRVSGFAISNVRWVSPRTVWPYVTDESAPTDIEQVDVTCEECSHHWTARHREPDGFTALLVHIHLTCPSCGHEESIAIEDLRTA